MSSANLKVSSIFNATMSLVITSPMVSRLILSVAESIDHSPSTLLGGFNLHHGNRLDDSIAAAGGTFACFLNALVALGKRPNLVERAAHYQKGFRNHIVPIIDVPALVQEFKSYGCYATYFFFFDDLLTYMSAQSGSPTVSGYEGKV